MKLYRPRTVLGLLATCAITAGAFAGDFLIHNGDRVVFLGDSITEQRLYTTYIEAYALTREPGWSLWFRNVGWGGDTAWLRQRARTDENQLFAANGDTQQKMVVDAVGRALERDVLPLKPTFVTVKFGMNDHYYQPFREDIFHAYVRSQKQIAEVLKGKGARVAFLTPQPIEEKRSDPDKDPRNQSLRKFSDGLKDVARDEGVAFVDQFAPYMAMLLRERVSNPPYMVGGGDAVHPNPIGHTVMAWAVLKGLGAPALVSRVELDAKAGQVKTAERCRVSGLKVANGTVSFERLDEALPMPIDERAEAALKLAPVLDDLNRYQLQISGLGGGAYEVSIDGEVVAKVTGDDLAKGLNLATTAGPITKQARQILNLVFQKNDVYLNRWRNVQLYEFPAWVQSAVQTAEVEPKRAAELDKLDRQIADFEAQIEAARKLKPHHFDIKSASQ